MFIEDPTFKEENLIIDSITLLDGVTLDEAVQYKVGRKVVKLFGDGRGKCVYVFYDEKRFWSTFPIDDFSIDDDKVVIKDSRSIYTFKRIHS